MMHCNWDEENGDCAFCARPAPPAWDPALKAWGESLPLAQGQVVRICSACLLRLSVKQRGVVTDALVTVGARLLPGLFDRLVDRARPAARDAARACTPSKPTTVRG